MPIPQHLDLVEQNQIAIKVRPLHSHFQIKKNHDMSYSPIVVFAFNRPNLLQQTLQALKQCRLAKESDLYIYIDGPRNNMDVEKVDATKSIARHTDGFKSVTCKASPINKGLAQSVISGVSEIINRFGKVIVVEDDLYVSKGFLEFMNYMLNKYEQDERIFQVSGFGIKVNSKGYPYDYYMHIRAQSWTWGTWKDRWETIDWQVKDFPELLLDKKKQRAFNQGGSDLFEMLKRFMAHKNNSWYIRFTYAMFCQGRYAIMPVRSLVLNDGFGKDATHCNTYNRYKVDFNEEGYGNWEKPERIVFNQRISHEATKYWTIRYRIYGKLMTIIQKLLKR